MSNQLSGIKLFAISCLSITALTTVVKVSSASADDFNRGYDRGYSIRSDRRDSGVYQGKRSQRFCSEFRQSIYVLERERTSLLRRNRYNPEKLRFVERELREMRSDYLRACR